MATAPNTSDNFCDLLTCSICLEIFKTPKYLLCLHTFCEICINQYILSIPFKDKSETSFKCPICRQTTSVGKSPGSPETWAGKLPINHFVSSMMDRQAIKSAEKLCDSCEANGLIKTADVWCSICNEAFCQSCEKCHRTFRTTSKHPVVSLKDISEDISKVIASSHIFCEEHVGELVKVYCTQHSKPMCTLCATLSHRKCEDIITLENAASGIKQSQRAIDLSENLKKTHNQLKKLIDDRKENSSNFENESQIMLQKITKTKEELLSHLSKIEENLRGEISKTKKQVDLRLSDETTVLSSFHSTVDNWIKILDTCMKYGTEEQYLLELNKVLIKKLVFDEEAKQKTSKLKNLSLEMRLHDTIKDVRDKISSFGEIKLLEHPIQANILAPNLTPSINFQTAEIKVIHIIQLDRHTCQTSGIFWNDCLVFVQWYAKKVEKYSIDGRKISELKLSEETYDITEVDKVQAAISTGTRNIYIVNLQEMTLTRTVTTSVSIYGICYISGKFMGVDGYSVYWINHSSGKLIRSVKSTSDQVWLISASSKHSYICAKTSNTVQVFQNDQNTFTYTNKELRSFRGIDVDPDGNIYICGFTSRNIHQLTKDAKLIKIITASTIGLEQPWVIRFLKQSNKFLVTCFETGKVALCEFI